MIATDEIRGEQCVGCERVATRRHSHNCLRGKCESTLRLVGQSIRGQCRSFRALNGRGYLTWGCIRDANLPQAENGHRIRDSIAQIELRNCERAFRAMEFAQLQNARTGFPFTVLLCGCRSYLDRISDRPQSTRQRPARAERPMSMRHSRVSRLLRVTSMGHWKPAM